MTLTATVDRLDGVRVENAQLTVKVLVRLNCGCTRYECARPGGGVVQVIRGAHCEARA